MNNLRKIIDAKVWDFLGPGFSTPFWTTIEIKTKYDSFEIIDAPVWIVLTAMKVSIEKLSKIFTSEPVKDLYLNNIDWIKQKTSEFNLSIEEVKPYIELGFLGAGEKEKWIEFSKLIGKRINFYRREDDQMFELKRTYFPIGFSIYRQFWFERLTRIYYYLVNSAIRDFIRLFE